jgi:hypothetical protein
MILQCLDALYRRLVQDESYGIAPPGSSQQAVSLSVVLTPQGELVQFSSIETEEHIQRGTKTYVLKKPRKLIVPGLDTKSGSGLNANYLTGAARYVSAPPSVWPSSGAFIWRPNRVFNATSSPPSVPSSGRGLPFWRRPIPN